MVRAVCLLHCWEMIGKWSHKIDIQKWHHAMPQSLHILGNFWFDTGLSCFIYHGGSKINNYAEDPIKKNNGKGSLVSIITYHHLNIGRSWVEFGSPQKW